MDLAHVNVSFHSFLLILVIISKSGCSNLVSKFSHLLIVLPVISYCFLGANFSVTANHLYGIMKMSIGVEL